MGQRVVRTRVRWDTVAIAAVVVVALVLGVWWVGSRAGGRRRASEPVAAPSPTATIPPPAPPPPCAYKDAKTKDAKYDQWQLTLVDSTFRLKQSYAPPDLVPLSQAGFEDDALQIRSLMVEDLGALREAAEAAGHPIEVEAAYRSYQQQASLFSRRVDEVGEPAALASTARPGHSEHQLGTTVDFKTAGTLDVTSNWARTPTGKWVAANAASFGFVLSYPKGREDVTCYQFEPWHYRYFGRDVAAAIVASALTVREYLWREREERHPPKA